MNRAMTRTGLCLVAAVLVAGCVSPAREAAFRREEVLLFQTRQQATVRCDAKADCDAAWARTRAFIKVRSASRIVHADDALIETALPHSFGFVYLAASRERMDDGRTQIWLRAMCRGMYDTDGHAGLLYSTCANSIVAIEAEFHAWMTVVQ